MMNMIGDTKRAMGLIGLVLRLPERASLSQLFSPEMGFNGNGPLKRGLSQLRY